METSAKNSVFSEETSRCAGRAMTDAGSAGPQMRLAPLSVAPSLSGLVMRDWDYMIRVARYIRRNPAKAKLCEDEFTLYEAEWVKKMLG